jgi:DedD protein
MRFPFLRSKNEPDQAGNAPGRKPSAARQAVDDAQPADAIRTRARRRLMGALALLLVGIIGFPLLFDTKPRPISGDVPMELVRRDGSVAPGAAGQKVNKPLPVTTVASEAAVEKPAASVSPSASATVQLVAPPAVAKPSAPTAAVAVVAAPVAAPAAAPAAVVAPPPAPMVKPAAPALTPPAVKPAAAVPVAAATPAPSAAPAAGRFVVQVGAYSALGPMREARAKVEKLGLKTYTQIVETDAGPRTRLRVGPFDKREQADAAAAKLKLANLPANILTL